MLYSSNYNLKKPEGTDIVEVDDLNYNTDVLDTLLTPSADPLQVPKSNGPAKLPLWISWIANRIKAVTGKTNWYDEPDITLAGAKAHVSSAAPHSGHVLASDVVAQATANKILKLDAAGKLPASITGDADTLDGKHAADFAAASHSHGAGFTVRTGTIPDQGKITPTEGYKNHKYFVSLAAVNAYSGAFDIPLVSRGTYPNTKTVGSDTTRIGYTCTVNQETLVVTARVLADNNEWVSGTANYIEIAWN